MTGRAGVERRGAVVRQALRNPDLRRVLAAFPAVQRRRVGDVGRPARVGLRRWGHPWLGRDRAGPAGPRRPPGRALRGPPRTAVSRARLGAGYATQSLGYLAVGLALVAEAPVAVVGLAAAVASVTVTLTRPTHNALLPEISRTTGDLTAGNAASGSLEALATFLGPLASGLLLAAWGAGGVLLTMAGCSALCVLLVARLATGHPAGRYDGPRPLASARPADRPEGPSRAVDVAAHRGRVRPRRHDGHPPGGAGPGRARHVERRTRILNSALGVGGIAGAALTFTLIGRARLAGPLVLGALVAGLAFAAAGQAGTPAVALSSSPSAAPASSTTTSRPEPSSSGSCPTTCCTRCSASKRPSS